MSPEEDLSADPWADEAVTPVVDREAALVRAGWTSRAFSLGRRPDGHPLVEWTGWSHPDHPSIGDPDENSGWVSIDAAEQVQAQSLLPTPKPEARVVDSVPDAPDPWDTDDEETD